MLTIGISAIDKESTVAILDNDEVLYAVSEERLTRVKQQDGFPWRALEEGLKVTGVRLQDVDAVTYPFLATEVERHLRRRAVTRNIGYTLRYSNYSVFGRLAHLLNSQRILPFSVIPGYNRELEEGLEKLGIRDKLRRYHHQVAHAASAFYSSGYERALVLTLDGYGSGLAGGFFTGAEGRIKLVQPIEYPHSMGGFYGGLTKRLGFVLHRHEGKVLGLAAFGDPTKLFDRVMARFDISSDDSYRFIDANNVLFDIAMARKYSREDVAAAYQAVLEKVICHYVEIYVRRTGCSHVCLAGGVVANVKLNQRIMEVPGVEKVFVYPGMSDVGTSVGGALVHVIQRLGGLQPKAIRSVYLSREIDEQEMADAIAAEGLPFRHYPEGAEPVIADLLARRNVVGRFNGRMEYGPRALGNRSILYEASDPAVNKWLNDRLRRTEFMPFAPACIGEDAAEHFLNVEKAAHSAEFMTITFDCTEKMKRENPAAVHVDGTARPQLVYERTNPSFYRILQEYKKRTGRSVLINTSYNMHEEPIVYTPRDAVRAFLDSGIDYLAIGNFICWQPDQPQKAVPSGINSAVPA